VIVLVLFFFLLDFAYLSHLSVSHELTNPLSSIFKKKKLFSGINDTIADVPGASSSSSSKSPQSKIRGGTIDDYDSDDSDAEDKSSDRSPLLRTSSSA
jgi:hypothetical protein